MAIHSDNLQGNKRAKEWKKETGKHKVTVWNDRIQFIKVEELDYT